MFVQEKELGEDKKKTAKMRFRSASLPTIGWASKEKWVASSDMGVGTVLRFSQTHWRCLD
jgi:hypothetical protein